MLSAPWRWTIVVCAAILLGIGGHGSPVGAAQQDPEPPVSVTVNPFMPTERSLSDCLSALPKPGCGSEARGGLAQTLVLVALVGGLGVVFTRIVVGLRRTDGPSRTPPSH